MSQRIRGSLMSQTFLRSQEKVPGPGPVFNKIISESGVKLAPNENTYVLTQEQALVVRDIENNLKDNRGVEQFTKDFKELTKNDQFLKGALLPTQFKKNLESSDFLGGGNVQIQQESLIGILLKVNCLQNEVIEILLKEITSASEDSQDTSWLRHLLYPLRYLPHISEPEKLTTKLLDILEIAVFPAQLEIIDSIPEILPDSQYGEIARQLSKLMDANDDLCSAIIDCLSVLDLDAEIRAHVKDRILALIASGTVLKTFPVFLQFLMIDCKSENIVQTFIRIRNSLDTIMTTGDNNGNKEKESCKIMIFNKLQSYSISKMASEAWLNMIITIKVHSDHKPIDCLILFMLHSSVKSKKRIIEALIKSKVHNGLLRVPLLEKAFEKYISPQLLKDYFGSIIEIACSLIRSSSNQLVIEFASTLFKILFDHQSVESFYRREILDNLILLTGVLDRKSIGHVLNVIHSFLDNNKLHQHALILMRLLEQLDSFVLKDIKEVFEILCTLTCSQNSSDSLSGLKNDIHMIVRKQLSSAKRNIKYRGIISAVVMAKHIAVTSEEQTVDLPDSTIITLAWLPEGRPREAASLLELVTTSISGCVELKGFYYDQLTAMLLTNNFDKYFMAWLNEIITNEFENVYITNELPQFAELRFSLQYELNTPEELDNNAVLGVNIAGLTMDKKSTILLLAPHFRLLRLLHYKQQAGDISSINACLGCAVILPDVEDFAELDTIQLQQVSDCLFHCVNWFREIISGFVTQKSKSLKSKVVKRLQDLLEVEKKLMECLSYIPEHKVPVSYFDCLLEINKTNSLNKSEKKVGKKKFKPSTSTVNVNDTTMASVATQKTKKKSTTKSSVHLQEIVFRELDTDLIVLTKYPLKFEDNPNDITQSSMTQTATLNIEQLKFILKDFILKLSVLTQGKDIGLSHLTIVKPSSLINDCLVILPKFNSHLKILISKLNKLLETTDCRHDLPEMFTKEALNIKECFGLIIQAFYMIFSWSGFHHSANLELLKNLLKKLRDGELQTLSSANMLIVEFISRLGSYYEQCLSIEHAVYLVKTMEALYGITVPSPEIQKKIVSVAEKLLSKRWYNDQRNLDSGKNFNINLNVLITAYLKGADVKTIYGLVGKLQEQVGCLKSKEDCLHMLASIDKQNFHVLYLGLCNSLLEKVKTEVQSLTNSQHLTLWRLTALTMIGLKTIANLQETKTNLSCFLKKSIGILRVFLSHGIPILEIVLRSKPNEVADIFRTIQTTTRFLHHLCCYSKMTRDASLMALVPKFRLTLETLIYRVKATLVANNCSDAFWMGNLRNRDLHGDDILSQSTSITDETGQDVSEDLPEDIDVENVLDDSFSNENDSESEIYD